MSSSGSQRADPRGIVADAIRRPVREAAREGVEEALRERGTDGDGSGAGAWRFVVLALVAAAVAGVLLRRRLRADGVGGRADRRAGERDRETGADAGTDSPTGRTVSGEALRSDRDGDEVAEDADAAGEAAPGAGSEDD